jgi:hypothetical protein
VFHMRYYKKVRRGILSNNERFIGSKGSEGSKIPYDRQNL